MDRVFATAALPGERFEHLGRAVELVVHSGEQPIPRTALLEGCRGVDGLVCLLTDPIDDAVLAAAGAQLKVVATCSVGVDHIDLAACARRGVLVCNTPGVLTEATADLAWALILGAARRVGEGDRLVRAGQFRGWRNDLLLGLELHGATLGVVGYGRIGRAVARRAAGFGMRVLCSGHRLEPGSSTAEGALACDLDELLASADVVSLHVPLTAQTRGLIGADALDRMKPGAYLVNTSRGPVVDELALVQRLRSGHLAGAGLDVYEREPNLAPGLAELPNVLLLPHLGSATHATRTLMANLAVADLAAGLAGRPALHPVPLPALGGQA